MPFFEISQHMCARLVNERTTMRVGVCEGSLVSTVFSFQLHNSNYKADVGAA